MCDKSRIGDIGELQAFAGRESPDPLLVTNRKGSPMGHALLDTSASHYDPATLKLLGQVFDVAWRDIAGNYSDASTIEGRRTRLATIILELVNNGERNIDEMKTAALHVMRIRERPVIFPSSLAQQ